MSTIREVVAFVRGKPLPETLWQLSDGGSIHVGLYEGDAGVPLAQLPADVQEKLAATLEHHVRPRVLRDVAARHGIFISEAEATEIAFEVERVTREAVRESP